MQDLRSKAIAAEMLAEKARTAGVEAMQAAETLFWDAYQAARAWYTQAVGIEKQEAAEMAADVGEEWRNIAEG